MKPTPPRRCLFCLCLTLGLFATAPAVAQEEPDADTPANPVELLDGRDLGEGISFWMMQEEAAKTARQYNYWSITRDDNGVLLCEHRSGAVEAGDRVDHIRQVRFSAKGELVSLASRLKTNHFTIAQTGRVEKGVLVLDSVTEMTAGGENQSHTDVKRIELKQLKATSFHELLPLVLSYHARRGNLGFHFMTSSDLYFRTADELIVENNGSERVGFDGAEHDAYVMQAKGKITFTDHSDTPVSYDKLFRVLKDGRIFSIHNRKAGPETVSSLATAEQIKKAFGPEVLAGTPDEVEVEGQEAQDAQTEQPGE